MVNDMTEHYVTNKFIHFNVNGLIFNHMSCVMLLRIYHEIVFMVWVLSAVVFFNGFIIMNTRYSIVFTEFQRIGQITARLSGHALPSLR